MVAHHKTTLAPAVYWGIFLSWVILCAVMKHHPTPLPQDRPDSTSPVERLAEELADTNRYLRYTFSLKMIVVRGVITGCAIVIGSTVFASILFSVVQLIFGDVPFIPSKNYEL